MIYRRAHQRCGSCRNRSAVAQCARCSAPLCIAHVPLGGERCSGCEESYRHACARLWPSGWRGAGFLAAAPAAWLLADPLARQWQGKVLVWGAFTSGLALLEAAIILLGGGALLGWLVWRARLALARRRFLAER
jgi:hypothetical protein